MAELQDPVLAAGERDIRVEDYVNDKIQTVADLKDLDSLIAKVEEQKKVLQLQLQDVQTKLSQAKEAALNQSSSVQEQNAEFQMKYQSVQERLMIVTSSHTPEQAIARMQGPMNKLHKVELAQSYVELLKDVGDLTRQARDCLPADPKGALVPYTRLKELAILLADLQEPTEGAAVHLVSHVQKTADTLWTEMKKIMTDEFEAVLKKAKWPETDTKTTQEWNDCFKKLLDLQGPELTDARTQSIILLPMAVLSKNFIMQFRYHFFSDKATNHPHQLGDFFFEWFIGTVAKWESFLRKQIGPVLSTHFRSNTILSGNSIFVDPVAAFITALLPVLKEKVNSVLDQIPEEYLSRFILQILNFDEKLRTQFRYDAGNPGKGWKGLTWDVLDVWFDKWLKVEKDFAWKRYKQIIDNEKVTQPIDPDSGVGKTKATFASLQLRDLMLSITTQYNKVRRFSQKMMFLIDIQAEIMDDYIKYLTNILNTFTQMAKLGRVAFTREALENIQGTNGLERLCRVYCSAEHLATLCREWSNETFFISLWDELQARAAHHPGTANLAGDMTLALIKDATSRSVGTEELGSVFDETISSFMRLRDRAEELIVKQLEGLKIGEQAKGNRMLEEAFSERVCKSLRRQVVVIPWGGMAKSDDEAGDEEE